MGNIGSQTGQITQHPIVPEEQRWAHSFPRTQPRLHQHKVLPERDARQKLRHTNNGEILQSGGTLTGRHQPSPKRQSIEREDDITPAEHIPRPQSNRTYFSNQRDPLHKSGPRYAQHFQNGFSPSGFSRENMKKFGSEPDLRQSKSEHQERIKAKKKYKAPPPPNLTNEKLDWDENSSAENGPCTRKARLFKTRVETKKNYSSPVHKHKSLEQKPIREELVQIRERDRTTDLRSNRLSLPEMMTSPNFHQELKEVTKRLRNSRGSLDELSNNRNMTKEKLKTLDHNINGKDNIRQRLKQMEESKKLDLIRGDGSGKESSSPSPRVTKKEQPKTFYFGMDETRNDDSYHNDIIEHFASNLQITSVPKITNSSESDVSSEIEVDETQTSRNGIDLQLRPILPKKQLEIPRFSPAAAWRLLSTFDSNHPTASTIASDDVPVFIEERIEKYSRPPPPTMQIGQRSNNDKSGDSGISGDAGPTGYDDTPEVIMHSRNIQTNRVHHGISWTPQQDLGDDSSMEEGMNNSEHLQHKTKQTKFTNKPHVFSLSLPRDNHLSAYMCGDKSGQYSGLQKLKRSVSGVLGNLNNGTNIKKDFTQPNQDQSNNWFFSKSAPNSLNNGFNSLEVKSSHHSDEKEQFLVNSKQSSGRVMYLPEFDNSQDHRHTRAKGNKDELRERSKSADRLRHSRKLSVFSKSCENINGEVKSSSEPEDLQDPPKSMDEPKSWRAGRKPKRFTFQSTVRQIERKRLAEKLSREAEKKEKQRLRELEAMQKVEEEFQKKRAREKATIRQQLRLFSMDDTAWTSLPPNLENKEDVRQEPDGAVSSSATSSPSLPLHKVEASKKVYQKNRKATNTTNVYQPNKHRPSSESSEDTRIKAQVTQVLSEYRHPHREYKEYTGSTRFLNDVNENLHVKHTTVHPQVTCNMPKAKGQSSNKTSGTNYRKDFAHGVKSSRSAGSTYSEDSQSRNNSPRMYHNKYTPITRF